MTSFPLRVMPDGRSTAGPDAQTASPSGILSASIADTLLVEAVDADTAGRHVEAWEDLAARSLEPNPFMVPGFCLPAVRHLGAASSLQILLVWDRHRDAKRRLLAAFPLVRLGPLPWPPGRVWFHDLAALGAPLLDRDAAEAALVAALAWMGRNWPFQAGLTMTALLRDGPTARLLKVIASDTGRRVAFLDPRERAILEGAGEPAGLAMVSARRRKEFLRQRRRLSERGALRYESADAPPELQVALERFLVLEAQGWKGRAGTALGSTPGRAAFVREMVERMGARGQCRIDALMLDGTAVAMGIVLTGQDRHYFWKTAFAEDLAGLSPGVQFALDLTEAQQRRQGLEFTDSCAMPDHPMIDRLWPGRLTIVDAVVKILPHGCWRFSLALTLEKGRRAGRVALKSLYARLRAVCVR